jgi:hypothetical protein
MKKTIHVIVQSTSKEMSVQGLLQIFTKEVTENFIENFSIQSVVDIYTDGLTKDFKNLVFDQNVKYRLNLNDLISYEPFIGKTVQEILLELNPYLDFIDKKLNQECDIYDGVAMQPLLEVSDLLQYESTKGFYLVTVKINYNGN